MPSNTPNARPADPVVDGAEPPADLIGRFQAWDRIDQAHWSGWREEAREAYDFYAGRQWTVDEVRQLETLNRIPVVFNRLAPTIDAVSGAEIGARQQVQYFPRQVGDTAVDDILTEGAEWIMDECEGNEEDSEAFRDVLICGVGATETRPDFDLDSRIIKERVDPLELTWDASSRKACFADARHVCRRKPMSKEEFAEQWPGFQAEADGGLSSTRPVIVDPRIRYDGTNEDGRAGQDEVIVRDYQWFERETRHLVGGEVGKAILGLNPAAATRNGLVMLTPEQHNEVQAQFPGTRSAQIKQKVYYRAFVAGNQILDYTPLELDDFTYTAMTGKRDRNKGVWYGLVRPMVDPQKWANKFKQTASDALGLANAGLTGGEPELVAGIEAALDGALAAATNGASVPFVPIVNQGLTNLASLATSTVSAWLLKNQAALAPAAPAPGVTVTN